MKKHYVDTTLGFVYRIEDGHLNDDIHEISEPLANVKQEFIEKQLYPITEQSYKIIVDNSKLLNSGGTQTEMDHWSGIVLHELSKYGV